MGTGFEIVYENNLDTHTFARIFNNTSQSYKFYWFEAILNLTKETDEDLSFEKLLMRWYAKPGIQLHIIICD